MANVCDNLVSNSVDLGFANDQDFKEFKAVLDKYEELISQNRGRVGLFKALAANATAKLAADSLTSSKAAATHRVRYEQLSQTNLFKDGISPSEYFEAVLESGKGLHFLEKITRFNDENYNPKVQKIAEHLKDMSPQKVQEGVRQYYTQKLEFTAAKYQDQGFIQSGRLDNKVSYKGVETDNVDHAMFMLSYDAWNAVEPMLAPKEQPSGLKKYQELNEEAFYSKIKGVVDSLDGASEIEKSFLADFLDAKITLFHRERLRLQSEGLFVEHNPNYVMSNYHDKPNLLLRGAQDLEAKGEKAPSPQRIQERAAEMFVEDIFPHIDKKYTFYDRNKQLQFMSEPDRLEFMKNKLAQMFDSMAEGLTINNINDELSQADNPALRLSSINRKLTNKVIKFKDGDSHYKYQLKTSEAYQRGATQANQGSMLFSRLMADGSALAKDTTIVSMFGTNPALTFRKFSPAVEEVKGGSSIRKDVMNLLSSDDSSSLRAFLFPIAESSVLDISPETAKTLQRLVNNTDFVEQQGAADFLKTFKGSEQLAWYEKSIINETAQVSEQALQSRLFMINSVVDPLQTGMHLAEMEGVSLAAQNPMSLSLSTMATIIRYYNGSIQGKPVRDSIKSSLARMSGVKPEDLTNEVLAEVAQKLGGLKDFMRVWDKSSALERSKNRDSFIKHQASKFRTSKAFKLLGGLDMPEVQMIVEYQTRAQVSDMMQRTTKALKDGEALKSNYMKDLVNKHGLRNEDIVMIDDIYDGVLTEGFTVDMTKLTAPSKQVSFDEINISEDLFDKAYSNFYMNELRKVNQKEAARLDSMNPLDRQKAVKNFVNDYEDFIVDFKEQNPDVVKEWKQEFTDAYVRSKAQAVHSLYNEITDSVLSRVDDNGYLAKIMQGGSVTHRVVQSSFLMLKKFMLTSTQREIERGASALKGGKADFARHVGRRLAVYGTAGMMYQTLLGLISGEDSGVVELYRDITAEDLTTGQKLGKVFADIMKYEFTGLPVGALFTTMAYVMGGNKQMQDYFLNILMAPALSTFFNVGNRTIKAGEKELKRATGEEDTSQEEESRYKGYISNLEKIVKLTPAGNTVIPTLLMNYGLTPYLKEQADLTTEAYEKEEARADQAMDSNGVQIFFEDLRNRDTDTSPLFTSN